MAKKFLTPIGLVTGTELPVAGDQGQLFYKSDSNTIYAHSGIDWVSQGSPDVLGILTEFGLVSGDAGTTGTTAFSSSIEGGFPSTTTFATNYDGGTESSF